MPYGKNKFGHSEAVDVWLFGNLDFEFVSNFDIRISILAQLAYVFI
jgi:hypothetical protein